MVAHAPQPRPLFPLGQIAATPGAIAALEQANQTAGEFLNRHVTGDFGEVDEGDRQRNEQAIKDGSRILSAYTTRNGIRFWVITESDRSVTTLLLPDEY